MVAGKLKNSFSSIGEIDNTVLPSTLQLKITFSKNHLRYFVVSNTHARVLYFGDYTLHHVTDNEQLAERLQKIYEKDEVLQLPFAEVLIGLNTAYSLLPLDFSFMKKENDLLQSCVAANTNIAFETEEEVLAVFPKLFKRSKVIHLNSTLLHLLPNYLNDNPEKVFVNVQPYQLDVILFRPDRSLVMMNRFDYKTETDFIYFLLLCCDELKVNRETTELVLMGEVSENSKIYDVCYRYFKIIQFIKPASEISFAKEFTNFDRHRYFTLYNLSA